MLVEDSVEAMASPDNRQALTTSRKPPQCIT
jgi:hypothetical protein